MSGALPLSSRTVSPAALRFRAEPRTHRGMVRSRNEDALLVNEARTLWAVADGVGGHERGHEASAALVEELARCLDPVSPAAPPSALVQAIEAATERVHRRLRAEARRSGDGLIATTLAAVTACGGVAVALWAGDSRVYHQRGDRVTLLTHDHTAPGGAIARAVGAGDACVLDAAAARLAPRDRLLLCSDGLTKDVSDAALTEMLRSETGLGRCADRLLAAALEGGGRDNITLVLVEAL